MRERERERERGGGIHTCKNIKKSMIVYSITMATPIT